VLLEQKTIEVGTRDVHSEFPCSGLSRLATYKKYQITCSTDVNQKDINKTVFQIAKRPVACLLGPLQYFTKTEPNPYSKHPQPLPTVALPRYLRKKEPLRFAYVSEQAAGFASAYYIVHVNVSNIQSRN
jgi:hypothetical protein